MTVLFYILVGMFTALLFAATVCAVSKDGETDGICKYGPEEKKQ